MSQSSPVSLILASTSSSRKILLENSLPHLFPSLQLSFVPPNTNEELGKHLDARSYVSQTSLAKAQSVASTTSNSALILGVDTVMTDASFSKIIGKATSKAQAKENLRYLSSTPHYCLTSHHLLDASCKIVAQSLSVTKITFIPLSDSLIDTYLSTKEWEGKAGSYAIQGIASGFIKSIEGSTSSVVGLDVGWLVSVLSSSNTSNLNEMKLL